MTLVAGTGDIAPNVGLVHRSSKGSNTVNALTNEPIPECEANRPIAAGQYPLASAGCLPVLTEMDALLVAARPDE